MAAASQAVSPTKRAIPMKFNVQLKLDAGEKMRLKIQARLQPHRSMNKMPPVLAKSILKMNPAILLTKKVPAVIQKTEAIC